ncbi:MAG: helix-turn-helix domain-containing protein [Gemmatimonadaceae bacterium]
MNETGEPFDWRSSLREHRIARRISQPEIARRAGLSVSAVKGYEGGQRHPSSDALMAIIDAIGLPFEDANRIRAGAGYVIDLRAILNERYASNHDALREEVEHYAWPVFVTNQASDVLFANRAFRLVVGLESRPQPIAEKRFNILARASDPEFADRVLNWDQVMTFIIGLAKAETRFEQNLERPGSFVRDAVTSFLNGNPDYIRRLLMLWEAAPPIPHGTRFHYDLQWRHEDGGVLHFGCSMTVADIWDELMWHDWVPADAESWTALQEMQAAHR